MNEIDKATVADFGSQWTQYTDNLGYYGSLSLLADIVEPLLPVSELPGLRCADIGSGTGRIVNMLLDAGATQVTAVEPSAAFTVLQENTRTRAEQVRYANVTGEQLPEGPYDLVISLGVLHHVLDPAPIVRRAFDTLRPGGRMLVWLYGHEGNELYLSLVQPLRSLTRMLPDRVLAGVCHAINWGVLAPYIAACALLPLPMRAYMRGHLGKLSMHKRFLTIFDQLNPAYARYYRRAEAEALLVDCGFVGVRTHHRHGYSWTVIGIKPE